MTEIVAPHATLVELRAYYALMVAAMERVRAGDGRFADLRYATYEALLLDLGEAFVSQPLPRRYRRREPKACYWNTLALVRRNPSLSYCEGIALPAVKDGLGIPVKHAWGSTSDGRVIDVTWSEPERSAYIGLKFGPDEVRRFRALVPRGEMGILEGEWRIGHPLLKTGRLFPEG